MVFDEDYFMYGEDIDLSYTILKAGFKNYYLAKFKLYILKEKAPQRSGLLKEVL